MRDVSESRPVGPPVWSRAQGARRRNIDVWLEDAYDEKDEASLIEAHNSYRKLVPFRKSEGKAA